MVGVLILTHGNIGAELLEVASATLGKLPLKIQFLSAYAKIPPETLLAIARQKIQQLDHGRGVLILTDIYGATPCNIAYQLKSLAQIEIVSGINLPMLIRVLNYPRLSLKELAFKAASGGRDGIDSSNFTRYSTRELAYD